MKYPTEAEHAGIEEQSEVVTLLDGARKDDRVVTALHEAGHAVAYLSIRRKFAYLSAVDAQLVGNGQPIDAWDRAVTSMAGPAVESIIYHYGRGGDDDIYEWIIEALRQRREFAEEEPWDEPDDYILAGPYAEEAVPVALAAVTASWADIERIAAAALNTERLTYDEVLRLTAGGKSFFAELSRWQAVVKQR